MKNDMGEIRATINLQNKADLILFKNGHITKEKIRNIEIDAMIDTGAVMILLPRDVVNKLGLEIIGKKIVTLAKDEKIELDVAGDFMISICGREWVTDCLVGPPLCEPLIGQLVLERLDLVLNPREKTKTVNPKSPYIPHSKLKKVYGSRHCFSHK